MSTTAERIGLYTFEFRGDVEREPVSYQNRYGVEIAGDLYIPKGIDMGADHPAIVVGPPYGGVKEQTAGLYAQEMAARGFVALAFDPSYNGESGGEQRHSSSPDIFVEDFSAAVDFLGTLEIVDRDRIGVLGVCGSGGFSLSAAQVDSRIKAVATVSLVDMSRAISSGPTGSMTTEQRRAVLDAIAEARWRAADGGEVELTPRGAPLTVDENTDPLSREFHDYYSTPRGFHPNSITQFTVASSASFINFPLLGSIDKITPRPVLFVIGENALSRFFSEDAYAAAAEPKELYVVPGAGHVDLYDRMDLIPLDKLELFFTENLARTEGVA
jgi:uncharacterized protein